MERCATELLILLSLLAIENRAFVGVDPVFALGVLREPGEVGRPRLLLVGRLALAQVASVV